MRCFPRLERRAGRFSQAMRHFGIAFDDAVFTMRGLLPMNMGREVKQRELTPEAAPMSPA